MNPPLDPIEHFILWQRQAEKPTFVQRAVRGLVERIIGDFPQPDQAASLATADTRARPSTRMVLVKRADHQGFVFYTNYGSRKAKELDANPHAALLFHWPHVVRQVRIEGTVERLGPAESAAYFATRPRGSQLGAWASRQSAEMSGRSELLERVDQFRNRFANIEVPCPDFWGGYRLTPERIEFWQGRPDRLHERWCCVRERGGWRGLELMP